MKNKVFIKILLLIVFLSNIQLSFSQVSADLMKYWYYRNRLQYFVYSGSNKCGEGEIACVRNRLDPDAPESDSRKANADYGQIGKHDGLYIGVLATEYYLLKENGQTTDAANTLTELQNALTEFTYWWDYNSKQYFNRPNVQNGFFMRGNMPCLFFDTTQNVGFAANGKSHLSLMNKGLKTSDTWNGTTFNNFPKGHPGYTDHVALGDCTLSPQAMSEDEAIGMLLGCSLAAELADGTVKQMAKTECDLVLTYMLNCKLQNGPIPFLIFTPDGFIPPPSLGPSTYTHGPGLCESGYQITGDWKYRLWHALWLSGAQQIAWMADANFSLGNNDLTATCLAMGNYASWRIKKITHNNNWDTFYLLLWEVLNNTHRNKNNQKELLKKTTDQLDAAPCDGPYCYSQASYAGGGWATDYKWFKDEKSQDYGQDMAFGNYNGVDYMLLYNLYHIKTKDVSPFYVDYMDRNLIGTVNASTNFIGYSTIVSTQTINPNALTVNYKAGDSIHLKQGFHAIHGSNFHAYIGTIDCSDAESITPYYDSLISVPKTPCNDQEETDTTENNNIYLPCPNDTIRITNKICDTCSSFYWDFGNGQTSTLQYPKVFYATPGTYNVKVIFVDTSGVADTALFTVTAPDCRIYGTLTENPTCGGKPVAGVSLYLTYNGNHVNSVTPAVTQTDGSFQFNSTELYQLFPDTNLYTITSSSGIAIEEGDAKTINDWMDQSPLNLYYKTSVNQEWVKQYNGASSLSDGASALDLMGNIYITGFVNKGSSGGDMLTMKYDSSGTQLWVKTYNGGSSSSGDGATAITVDASGNVYITGQSTGTNGTQLTTISYTTSGVLRWIQNKPLNCGDRNFIIQDHAGNIIVGSSSSLFKYNTNGTQLWTASFTGRGSNLEALAVDANNNIYVSGYLGSLYINGYSYMKTAKYNSTGTQLWADSLQYGNFYNAAYSNAIDKDGNLIVTGNFGLYLVGIVTIKYSPSGTRNWVSAYMDNSYEEQANKVLCNDAGEIYVCGTKEASNAGMFVLKYNAIGDTIWEKNSSLQGGTGGNWNTAVLDNTGNLYMSGYSNINSNNDITTEKYNGDGNLQWQVAYGFGNVAANYPTQLKVSANGNVYVCGNYNFNNSSNEDVILLKYSQCLSTAPLLKTNNGNNNDNNISQSNVNATTLSANVSLQLVPNPNNGNMQVTYEIPANTNGTFEVYNLIGSKLFSYPLTGGKNTFSISRTDLNAGIYFYRAIAGNKLIGKDKIVVIK